MIASGESLAVRILLDYRPALRQRTGVGHYIHSIATALARRPAPDESLVLFSSSWRDRLAPDAVPGAATVDRRVPVRALNYAWHRLEWPPVESLSGSVPFDVVHAAHPLLIPTRRGAQVVTIHDLDFLDHPERTHAEIRRDYGPLAARHARRADHIVVNSRHTRDDVQRRLHVSLERITVCEPGAPDWLPRDDEPEQAGTILFIGALEPRKNLGVLLDAYARLVSEDSAAPRLVLAGPASPASEPILQRLRAAPFAGRVDLPGYVHDDAKVALLRQAWVLVLPSHTEGFGLPALEAMTVGVPVIVANRGALPDVVGDAGRLVDPDDAGMLAAALAEITREPSRRRSMAAAGLRQARQFTWDRTVERLRQAWRAAFDYHARRRG
jgi:glycosyltransferase involved in cell wall biosynthesis